jgi:hypothetical protein
MISKNKIRDETRKMKKELKKEVASVRMSYVIMSILIIFTISSSSSLNSVLLVQAVEDGESSTMTTNESATPENQDGGSAEDGSEEISSPEEEEESSSDDSEETSSSSPCPQGQHYDSIKNVCVPDGDVSSADEEIIPPDNFATGSEGSCPISPGCPQGQHYDSIENVCVDDTQHSPQPLAEDEPVQRSNSNQQPPSSVTSDGIMQFEDNGLTQTQVVPPLTSSQTSGSMQPTPDQTTNEYFQYQHCKLLLGTGAGWNNVPSECWNLINKYESPQGYRCVDEAGISRSNIEDCLPHDSNGELCPPPVTQPCQSSPDNTGPSGGLKPWIGGAGYSGNYRGIPCVQDAEGTCLGAPFAPGGSASDCFLTPADLRDAFGCGGGSGENDNDNSREKDNSPCSEFSGSDYDLCMENELDKALDGLGDTCDPDLDANCYGPQTCDPAQDPLCYDRGYPDIESDTCSFEGIQYNDGDFLELYGDKYLCDKGRWRLVEVA